MNKSDFIFWAIMAIIALFYLLKGNDIYRDYYKSIEESNKHRIEKQQLESKNE